MPRTCTLAIDVGGTFTDITFADAATGATWIAKTPSTPEDLSAGFITAVRKVLSLAGRGPADVLRVFHGTTTATNAILEGKTPPTARHHRRLQVRAGDRPPRHPAPRQPLRLEQARAPDHARSRLRGNGAPRRRRLGADSV